jgi:hypothetical protein
MDIVMRVDNDSLPLAEALQELVRRHGPGPSYWKLWSGVVSGRIPAHRCGREWRINRADLSAIAKALKLTDRAA